MLKLRKSLLIGGGILIGLLIVSLIAVTAITGYSMYKSFQIDYLNHQAMVGIVQYNLQQGKLLPVPQPVPPGQPQPAAVPVPDQPLPAGKK